MPRILPTRLAMSLCGLATAGLIGSPAYGQGFSNLSPAQRDALKAQFSQSQALTKVTRYGTRAYQRTLQQRGDVVTGYGQIANLEHSASESELLAQTTPVAESAVFEEAPFRSDNRPAMGLWFSGYGEFLDQEETNQGFLAYEADVFGGSLGHDWSAGEHGYVGIAAGASDSDIDFDDPRDLGEVSSIYAAFYSGWTEDRASVHGSVVYARHDYTFARNRNSAGSAGAEFESREWAANIEVAYDLTASDGHWLSPFAGLEYSQIDEESFTESGNSNFRQSVEQRDSRVLRSKLGLKAGHRWETSRQGILGLWSSLGYSYDFDLDDRIQSASLAGVPGSNFRVAGPETEKHGGQLGLGVSYGRRDSYAVALEAFGEMREDLSSYGGQFVFRKVVF